ncbi:MAG: tetratricopeptide repeat protein [Limisphaerales bacterium]
MNNKSDGKSRLMWFLLVLGIVVAYQRVWHAGFLWEDDIYITHNPLLTAPDGLRRIWFSRDSPSQYFPLTYTSFYAERFLWGFRPYGYHCVNILIHAGNALLAWTLLRRLRVPGAGLGAALFALHPVQVETVALITERKNLLMAFFFLLALLAWISFIDDSSKRRWRHYALALVYYMLSLAGKTTACTLPAALLLVVWFKREPINRRRLAEISPFVVLGIAMGVVTMWWERFHQQAVGGVFQMGLVERLLIASRALWFYAGKLLWPANLIFCYPRWNISSADARAYVWVLATAAAGVAIFRWRENFRRGPAVASLFYAATLAPTLGFIMYYTFRYTFVADHYQYLACLGPLALLAAGLERLPIGKPIGYVVLPVVLGVLTWSQCGEYANAETLWRATIAKNPSSWMARENLGVALADKGRIDDAIEQYRRALELHPDFAQAHNDLGAALFRKGMAAEAVAQYREAIRDDPNDANAHYNLGNALAKQGEDQEALEQLRIAARLRPMDLNTSINLANALFDAGRLDDAITEERHALGMAPSDVRVMENLGKMLVLKGDLEEAMPLLDKAYSGSSDPAEKWHRFARELVDAGSFKPAMACYRVAMAEAKAENKPALVEALQTEMTRLGPDPQK